MQRFAGLRFQIVQRLPVERRLLALFDCPRAMGFGRGDQADGDAFLAGAPGTSDAVNVDFRVARQFDVNHHVQRVDIQATCGDVGRDQHRQAAVGEHR